MVTSVWRLHWLAGWLNHVCAVGNRFWWTPNFTSRVKRLPVTGRQLWLLTQSSSVFGRISLPSSNLLYPIAQVPLDYLEKIKASNCPKIGRCLWWLAELIAPRQKKSKHFQIIFTTVCWQIIKKPPSIRSILKALKAETTLNKNAKFFCLKFHF